MPAAAQARDDRAAHRERAGSHTRPCPPRRASARPPMSCNVLYRSRGPRSGRSRALAALSSALLLGAVGCAAPKRRPVDTAALNRDTPAAAFEYLRAVVGAEQPEAEWKVFSPGFK